MYLGFSILHLQILWTNKNWIRHKYWRYLCLYGRFFKIRIQAKSFPYFLWKHNYMNTRILHRNEFKNPSSKIMQIVFFFLNRKCWISNRPLILFLATCCSRFWHLTKTFIDLEFFWYLTLLWVFWHKPQAIIRYANKIILIFSPQKMLNFEPNRRISASEAMRHPYFADFMASANPNVSSGSSPGSSPLPIILNQGRR